MKHNIKYFFLIGSALAGLTLNAQAQTTARDFRGPAAVVPLATAPAPELIVDEPLPGPLASGRVVIQYHTKNLRIVPVFGPNALDVTPRIGHLHVTVDDAPWHWADAGNEPLIINGLKPGPHRVLVQMADATHKVIESKTVSFIIPEQAGDKVQDGAHAPLSQATARPAVETSAPKTARDFRGPAAVVPLASEPPARLVVDAPLPDQLALGRVIVQYRSENLRIVPVFGEAARDVSPRIGHIHITVDGGPWRWADASNEPVVIVGMKAGEHRILIELADPAHKILDSQTITFTVPEVKNAHAGHH